MATGGGLLDRQNDEEHLTRLRAYSRYYQVSQRWRRVHIAGSLILAVAGPTLVLVGVDTRGVLGAVAAGWAVLGRALLKWLAGRYRERAVRIQELYDTKLFALPWNKALAGRQPFSDDVAAASRKAPKNLTYEDWYEVDVREIEWPLDVLLCQRQSMSWSRGDHRAYGVMVALMACALFVVGVVISLALGLSLADYLVKLFLPMSPITADAVEVAADHLKRANMREVDLEGIDRLIEDHRDDPAGLSVLDVRKVQDASFRHREDSQRVPGWFYKVRRPSSSADTRAGVAAMTAAAGGGDRA